MGKWIVYEGPSPARFVQGAGRFDRGVPVEVANEELAEALAHLKHFKAAKAPEKGKGAADGAAKQ